MFVVVLQCVAVGRSCDLCGGSALSSDDQTAGAYKEVGGHYSISEVMHVPCLLVSLLVVRLSMALR